MLPDSSRTVVATLVPQQLSFVFGGMSYTQSKRPSLIAADAVLCLPCEKTGCTLIKKFIFCPKLNQNIIFHEHIHKRNVTNEHNFKVIIAKDTVSVCMIVNFIRNKIL